MLGCGERQSTYLTYIEAIDTAWERVQVQDDVHTILLDCVFCDLLEIFLLIARMVPSARNLDPSCIRSWNTNKVHAARRKLVDILSGNICCIALLENRVALITKLDAAIPLVDSASAILVPPVWINSSFLGQPASKVDSVGVEISPINIVAMWSWSWACKTCRNESKKDGTKSGLCDHDCSRGDLSR